MIRRHLTALRLSLMIADAASAAVLFGALSIVILGPDWSRAWQAAVGRDVPVLALVVIYALGWVWVSWLVGLYRLRARWTVAGDLRESLRLGAIAASAWLIVLFVLDLSDVSRPLLAALFPGQVAVTFLSRTLIRRCFEWFRVRGYNSRRLLIIGTGSSARSFAALIRRHPELGLHVTGFLRAGDDEPIGIDGPILGSIDDIPAMLHEDVIDEVAICLPASEWKLIEPMTVLCRDEGKAVRIPLHDIGLAWPTGRVEEFDGVPILSHAQVPDQALSLVAKRLIDIALSSVALVALAPVFVGTALAIALTEGSPILFRQVRVGLHGRPFTIVKFRTMVADAEVRYAEVVQLSDTQGAAFKMTDDPRITRLGRLLRRTSIDELPQLWNVLRGEMSLVGPRPAPPREVAEYDVWHRRRLSMKPGITGLWQVEARLDESFDRRAALDLRYIDAWSIWLDLKIILRTIPAMLQGR